MNRLYVVESTPTATGTIADHRWALAPAQVVEFALALAGGAPPRRRARSTRLGPRKRWPPTCAPTAAAPWWWSARPASRRSTRSATRSTRRSATSARRSSTAIRSRPRRSTSWRRCARWSSDLNAGRVDLLLVLGANPVYDAPADLDFAAAIQKAALRIHPGLYDDETAQYCHWHIPPAHDLETWGDVRAFDGTVTIQQPLIEPLYDGKSAIEVVAALAGDGEAKGMDLVRGDVAAGSTTAPGARPCTTAGRRHGRGARAAAPVRPGSGGPRGSRRSGGRRLESADPLQAGPDGPRRPLRQQRLAPGAARSRSPS